VAVLLLSFSSCITAIQAIIHDSVKKLNPSLTKFEEATVMWFSICGCIHIFFEGYFVLNAHQMGKMTDIFGQLWKEYTLSDSRYLAQDGFVWCVETMTVVRCLPHRPDWRRSLLLLID
jgi:cholestenol Delta-isomerase